MSDNLVNDTNSTRLGGIDRYDTNKKIVNKFYNGAKEFYIASGTDLVYALVGSTIAKNDPIILVDTNSDKNIFEGSSKITAISIENSSIIQQCIDVSNGIKKYGWIKLGDSWHYYNKDGTEVSNYDLALKKANKVLGDKYEAYLIENTDSLPNFAQTYLDECYFFGITYKIDDSDSAILVNKKNFYAFQIDSVGRISELEKYSDPSF